MNDIMDQVIIALINHENTAENVLKNAFYAQCLYGNSITYIKLCNGFLAKDDARKAKMSLAQ